MLFTPVEPAPVLFTPVEPAPVLFTPVEPAPVLFTPVEPAPVLFTPVEPAPVLVCLKEKNGHLYDAADEMKNGLLTETLRIPVVEIERSEPSSHVHSF